jgi:hypothetical protein
VPAAAGGGRDANNTATSMPWLLARCKTRGTCGTLQQGGGIICSTTFAVVHVGGTSHRGTPAALAHIIGAFADRGCPHASCAVQYQDGILLVNHCPSAQGATRHVQPRPNKHGGVLISSNGHVARGRRPLPAAVTVASEAVCIVQRLPVI